MRIYLYIISLLFYFKANYINPKRTERPTKSIGPSSGMFSYEYDPLVADNAQPMYQLSNSINCDDASGSILFIGKWRFDRHHLNNNSSSSNNASSNCVIRGSRAITHQHTMDLQVLKILADEKNKHENLIRYFAHDDAGDAQQGTMGFL